VVLAGSRHSRFPGVGVLHMTGFQVLYALLADETDRAAIYAALPTIQADIDMVADDVIKLSRDIKILNRRLTPLFDAMRKVSG
jgi:hypothetical protein